MTNDGPDRPECTSNNVNISPTLRVVVGSTFSISCTADSNPLPNIYQLSGQGGNNLQLSFIDIARSQAGSYIIEARNNMSASDGAANLQLLLNNVSNASVEIEEHSTNNLQCSLESNPASHMFIVKDGKTILERPGVHQLIHGMTAECSDTGVYTCSGYNQYGTGGSARKPTGVVVKLFYTARQHENVTLWYTIAAYPVPKPSQFVWQGCRNASEGSCSNSLDGMLKYNVKSEGLSSFLTIRDVNIEDFGMYQLSVSNGIGSPFIEWLHLIPIGKPESPSGFHVIQEEIRETSAVLTWVPGFDNGSPQTFYITYTKKGDLSGWITMSIQHTHKAQINYTLRSLEPETEYIASIYASNENGFSPTINDTFITLKHIPGEQEDSHAGLIGGSVGGIAAVLVIIAVVFIVKKFRTSGASSSNDLSIKSRFTAAISY
ncbi:NCAM2-like protein [Mya arenaria]|uniref:NCAM2-like protein n=1 Tax=Mya arenaria TaxID=6604 RepID=A0ABY7EE30_MYAAR|nr:NCAM2-like protein [Mya arenaria]